LKANGFLSGPEPSQCLPIKHKTDLWVGFASCSGNASLVASLLALLKALFD
jgi:hypothetical protein